MIMILRETLLRVICFIDLVEGFKGVIRAFKGVIRAFTRACINQ